MIVDNTVENIKESFLIVFVTGKSYLPVQVRAPETGRFDTVSVSRETKTARQARNTAIKCSFGRTVANLYEEVCEALFIKGAGNPGQGVQAAGHCRKGKDPPPTLHT